MDKTEAELAIASREIAVQVYSENYAEINRRLNESLVGRMALESLMHDNEQAKFNSEMIADLVGTLPRPIYSNHVWQFLTTRQSDAAWLEECVFWDLQPLRTGYYPYYILGAKIKPNAEVLLFPAAPAPDISPRSFRVKKKDLPKLEVDYGRLDRQYSPEELETLFSQEYNCLAISSRSPYALRPAYGWKNRTKRVRTPLEPGLETYPHGIPDHILGEFNVLPNLNRLATAFGQDELWARILERRKAQADDSPQTKAIES